MSSHRCLVRDRACTRIRCPQNKRCLYIHNYPKQRQMYLGVFPFLPTDKRFAARFREADSEVPCPSKKGSPRSSSRSRRLDVALELAEFKEGVANSDTVSLTGAT